MSTAARRGPCVYGLSTVFIMAAHPEGSTGTLISALGNPLASGGNRGRFLAGASAHHNVPYGFLRNNEVRFWTLFASSPTSPPPWSSKSTS